MSRATDLMKEMNKAFGVDVIRQASHEDYRVRFIPTGVKPIDWLLQGGLPRGRSVELYGPYSTLKSYVGLSAIAQCQMQGGVALLVDTENAFDPEWAAEIGVDVDEMLLVDRNMAELAEEQADAVELALRNGVDLIVWDSIAATLPKAEARDDKGALKSMTTKTQPARQAKFMSDALRRLNTANRDSAMLWINQTREKIGVMFGDPTTTPGGKAMGFYASYRIAMSTAGKDHEAGHANVDGTNKTIKVTVAQKIRASLVKSKLNKPFRDVFFTFDLRQGRTDDLGFVINQGVDQGLIKIKGASWTYGPVKGSGAKKFRAAMDKSPYKDRLTAAVMAQATREPLPDPEPSDDPPRRSKAASTKPPSSEPEEPESTPTAAPAASRTTGRTKSTRTRSSGRTRATRSRPRR